MKMKVKRLFHLTLAIVLLVGMLGLGQAPSVKAADAVVTLSVTLADGTVQLFTADTKTSSLPAAQVLKTSDGTTLEAYAAANNIDFTDADQWTMPYGSSMYRAKMASVIDNTSPSYTWTKYYIMLGLADTGFSQTNPVIRAAVTPEYRLDLTYNDTVTSFYMHGTTNTNPVASVMKERDTDKTTLASFLSTNKINVDDSNSFVFPNGDSQYSSTLASSLLTAAWNSYCGQLNYTDTSYDAASNRVFRAAAYPTYTFILSNPNDGGDIEFLGYGTSSATITADYAYRTITASDGTKSKQTLHEYLTAKGIDNTDSNAFSLPNANSAYAQKMATALTTTPYRNYVKVFILADATTGSQRILHMSVPAVYTFSVASVDGTSSAAFTGTGSSSSLSPLDFFKDKSGASLRDYLTSQGVDASSYYTISDLFTLPYANSTYMYKMTGLLVTKSWTDYCKAAILGDSAFKTTSTIRGQLLANTVYTIAATDWNGTETDFHISNLNRQQPTIDAIKDADGQTFREYLGDHAINADSYDGYLSLPNSDPASGTILSDFMTKNWNVFGLEGATADTTSFATANTIHVNLLKPSAVPGVTVTAGEPTKIDLSAINGDVVISKKGLYIDGVKADLTETGVNPNGYELTGTTDAYTVDCIDNITVTLLLNNVNMTSTPTYSYSASSIAYPFRFNGYRNVSCINVSGANATIELTGSNSLTYHSDVTADTSSTMNGCALEKSGMDGSLVIRSHTGSEADSLTATGISLHDGAIGSSLFQADNRPDGVKNGGFANLTISSGTVTANGGQHNPGIGAICHSYVYSNGTQYTKNIVITGDHTIVNAKGNDYCAGIGSGLGVPVDGITISDGAQVTAAGGIKSPGIGSGGLNDYAEDSTLAEDLDVTNISITGGRTVVTATGGENMPAIGCGYSTRTDVSKTFTGTVTPDSLYTGYIRKGTADANTLVSEAPFTTGYDLTTLTENNYLHVYFNTREISGVIFADHNNNGIYDEGDAVLTGQQISLQTLDDNGTVISESAGTQSADGTYTFSVLPGKYRVVSAVPAAMHITDQISAISGIAESKGTSIANVMSKRSASISDSPVLDFSAASELAANLPEFNAAHTLYISQIDAGYTANTYKVSYTWTGDHPDKTVPDETDGILSGSSYTVDTTYQAGDSVTGTKDGISGTWTFNGWDQTGSLTITGDVLITGTWTFTPAVYQITTDAVHGTITPSFSVDAGKNADVVYAPEEGYELTSVTVDGVRIDITKYPSSYSFTDVEANHDVKVVYTPKPVPTVAPTVAPTTAPTTAAPTTTAATTSTAATTATSAAASTASTTATATTTATASATTTTATSANTTAATAPATSAATPTSTANTEPAVSASDASSTSASNSADAAADSADTGDRANVLLFGIILLVASVIAIWSLICQRRKEE